MSATIASHSGVRLVVHQPAEHPYVRHLGSAVRSGAAVDPPCDVWEIEALAASGAQIVHLHFGYEQMAAEALASWLDQLAAAGIRLVHTVHDLDNPHLVDQRHYHALQARIVAAADHVLTLTPAAARRIRSMHGREAEVVAHPHVVPLAEMDRRRRQGGRRDGVYVHAATLRPNLDLQLLAALAEPAGRLGGLRVHVRSTATALHRRDLERALAGTAAIVDVRPRLTDAELWDLLAGARLVALPYRWGTHSGLLEAAHDLGTPVLAPAFGGYVDQGATALDADDLAGALRAAVARPPRVDVGGRREHGAAVTAAHRRIYERLLAS